MDTVASQVAGVVGSDMAVGNVAVVADAAAVVVVVAVVVWSGPPYPEVAGALPPRSDAPLGDTAAAARESGSCYARAEPAAPDGAPAHAAAAAARRHRHTGDRWKSPRARGGVEEAAPAAAAVEEGAGCGGVK